MFPVFTYPLDSGDVFPGFGLVAGYTEDLAFFQFILDPFLGPPGECSANREQLIFGDDVVDMELGNRYLANSTDTTLCICEGVTSTVVTFSHVVRHMLVVTLSALTRMDN